MKVYVDAYAPDPTDVLVGYKGTLQKQMRRRSLLFYIPLMLQVALYLTICLPKPLCPSMTRYGYVELNNTASH